MCECDILADILEQLALSSPVSILGFFLLCFISWQPHGISRLLLVARTRLLIQFAFNAFWPISLGLRLAISPANLRLAKGLRKMQIPFAFKLCVKLRTRLPKLIKVPAS